MTVVTKTIGAAGDYTTLAAWAAALTNGAVYTAGDTANGEVIDTNLAGGVAFPTSGVLPTQINLYPSTTIRHRGTRGSGCRLYMTSSAACINIQNCNASITIDGFEIDYATLFYPVIGGVATGNNGSNVVISNIIAYGAAASGSSAAYFVFGGNVTTTKVFNCIAVINAYYAGTGRIPGFKDGNTGGTILFANCAAVGCGNLYAPTPGYGFDFTARATLRNCISVLTQNGGADFNGTPAAASNNVSSDTTAPGTLGITSVNTIANFRGVRAGDFHLMPGSSLIGAGVAVSGLTTDIAGNTYSTPPSIGPFEYVPAGSTLIVIED